jgi:hypothetical protein
MAVILLNQSSNLITPYSSGVFGLGTGRQTGGDFQATVFGGFFDRNPNKTTFTYVRPTFPTFGLDTHTRARVWL